MRGFNVALIWLQEDDDSLTNLPCDDKNNLTGNPNALVFFQSLLSLPK